MEAAVAGGRRRLRRGRAAILELACSADARYAPHSAAMIHSVLTHHGGLGLRVHYLHGPSFPAAALARLWEMVESGGGVLAALEIDDSRIEGLRELEEISSAMWYRIFLPELLPDLDRVLYLDVDTIAADSLRPLWETVLGDSYVGAVTNVFQADHFGRVEELGLRGPEVYFNSGVLLMNLAAMRRDGVARAIRECAIANEERFDWPDQDALNVVLGARRLALHPRWNLMNSALLFPWAEDAFGTAALAQARANPAIRHFEGPGISKPWHLLCERPMRELYFEHRRRTPWPRVRPEGLTPANLARRALRGLRRGRRPLSA